MAEPIWQTGTVGSLNTATGERVSTPFSYRPAPPPSPMDILGKIASEAYTALPIEEAERATAAAIQFQGMRGYQQALKNGDPASKALAQWGPLMFYQKPQTIAPMIKATTPAQPYTWVPPTGGAPGHFAAEGQRPYVPPAASMPPDLTVRDAAKQEIFPGIFMVQQPGSPRWQIVNTNKKEPEVATLSPNEAASLLKSLPDLQLSGTPAATNLAPQLLNVIQSGVSNALNRPRPAVQTVATTVPEPSPTAAGQPAAKKRYTVKGGKLVPIQ